MNSVTLSIIIPTLNEEKFLPHLLDSLITQTMKDFEVIVSDGSSLDKTVVIVDQYKKRLPRLTLVQNTTAGLAMQRNTGAKAAKGKLLIFIDADGVFLPHALERMKAYIQAENIEHFTPWFLPDSSAGSDALLVLLINSSLEAATMMKRPVAYGQCSVMTRKVYDLVGGYNESLAWGEDNDISRRIFEQGYMLKILRETLVVYSLRRFRKQGTLRTLHVYAKTAFQALLTRKTPTNLPQYVMGGHQYTQEEVHASMNAIKIFHKILRKLTREIVRKEQ